MRSIFKFNRVIHNDTIRYETANAQAFKLCEQEGVGKRWGNRKYSISEEEMQDFCETYGQSIYTLEQDSVVRSDFFKLYKEEMTNQWVLILLDKNLQEIKPYFTGETKYKVLYQALESLIEKQLHN